MEQKSSANWFDGEYVESTSPSAEAGISVSAMAEEAPTLAVTTIVAVTVVVLIAIAVVFLLGVLIDFRQQRLLEKRLGEVKRGRRRRAVPHPESDQAGIVAEAEDVAVSEPPAAVLRDISVQS